MKPELKINKWQCKKCNKISPAIGIQIELSHKNISPKYTGDFEEIPTRRYCFYCWVEFFDKNVGQVESI